MCVCVKVWMSVCVRVYMCVCVCVCECVLPVQLLNITLCVWVTVVEDIYSGVLWTGGGGPIPLSGGVSLGSPLLS